MTLCINPNCPNPNNQANNNSRFCQSCGTNLLLENRYRIQRILSDKTGFGKIYEAEEAGNPKILKILKDELNNNLKAVELFEQEANVLGQLNHPGIPKVDGYFQFSTKNGPVLHCIAMEKIDGPNLSEWLQQRNNQPIKEELALTWLKQLTEILHLVHSQNYLHRDIKPSNIMLRNGGQLVLIDFGTAREMTYTYLAAVNAGNPVTAIESRGYTAPEQANGHAVPQSDFFSLGRTFVHLMTGRYPLDMYDGLNDLLNWRPYAVHISPLLLDFIDSLMAREVNKRPANTQAILNRLKEIEIELAETLNVVGGFHQTVPVSQPQKQKKFPLFLLFGALLGFLGYLAGSNNSSAQTSQTSPVNKLSRLVLIAIISPLIALTALALYRPVTCSLGLASDCFSTVKRPPGQPVQKKGKTQKIDYFPYLEGRDSQGRTAEFNIAVLSSEYKWKLGSSYQIQYNDRVINLDDLRANLAEEGIQKIMENPSEIVSVGTASCEGVPETEERRALERAQQIQLLVKKLFRNSRTLQGYRLLNLGQFVGGVCQPDRDATSYQRSVIIIGVRKKSDGVLLDEALRSRLEKKPFADFTLEDYSLGSPAKFITIPSRL
ncbi:serine/threonine protein kinase [Ancylothrix sp. C2]|uniref:serine/threonine protein kinase n=1 Tax=Ancylothrix sp. D3o TaxID=2953691 RepID=UPI0021BB12F5|nr:serine/threonine-protein kinase [Ancylothrix sp. D3o]MCT7951115.1 serine/threonine protein kinase [Ancylothrix sp. D3o]